MINRIFQPTPQKGEPLFRTMAMALIIAALICFVAMFWPLQQARPEQAGVSYYLPWCLAYGIPNLIIAGIGVFFTTVSKEKPALYKPGEIIGIVAGSIFVAEAFPIVIAFGNWEFFISVAVIGVCVIVIAALGLASLKDDPQ